MGILALAWACVVQVAEPPCPCHSRRCWGMSLRAFGKQPESFWRPVKPHMGPARKCLVQKVGPLITSWLRLACLLIHLSMNDSFQQALPNLSHSCLRGPLIQMPHHTATLVVPAQWYHLSQCHLAKSYVNCGWANI